MDSATGSASGSRSAASLAALLARYLWALPNTLIGLALVPAAFGRRAGIQVVDGVLELHGPMIDVILRYGVPLQGGAAAITFGHIVAGRNRDLLELVRRHERAHVSQCERWGPAFIPAYLVASAWALVQGRGAYEGNYFERQARKAEEDLSTRSSRDMCARRRSTDPRA